MEKVIITESDILNAKPYIPLVLKYTLAKYIAELSCERKAITVQEGGVDSIALPDMTQRNTLMEQQYKIGVFVKEYMGKTFDPVKESGGADVPYLMATDDADAWSDFETQIDRLKRSKNKEVADKCYEILNDYHAFCRMVSIEIEQELQIKNDPIGRFAWLCKSLINNFTMEDFQRIVGEIGALREELGESKEPEKQEE